MILQVTKPLLRQFLDKKQNWSIGIYTGETPFKFAAPENIKNPVLTARDVTDIPAEFVADPFMILKEGVWYMFFEALNGTDGLGDIALATSPDGFEWKYDSVVLDERFHLSYPYVFEWNHEYYMIPETYQTNSVRLYKADDFPHKWLFIKTLLQGHQYVDSSIFYLNDLWWILTSTTTNDILRLYYSDSLYGSWTEHPKSPVVENDKKVARPGGRVTVFNNAAIRYTQDCQYAYGAKVRAFAITELTPENYREELREDCVLSASDTKWNKTGMHNIDPHMIRQDHWVACVDGYYRSLLIKPGVEFQY